MSAFGSLHSEPFDRHARIVSPPHLSSAAHDMDRTCSAGFGSVEIVLLDIYLPCTIGLMPYTSDRNCMCTSH